MEIISLGRQGGKTHRMIETLERSGNYLLLTHNEHEANRIRNILEQRFRERYPDCADHSHLMGDLQLLRAQVMPATQPDLVAKRIRTGMNKTLFIDNLDLVLGGLFGKVPTSVTMTEPVLIRDTVQ